MSAKKGHISSPVPDHYAYCLLQIVHPTLDLAGCRRIVGVSLKLKRIVGDFREKMKNQKHAVALGRLQALSSNTLPLCEQTSTTLAAPDCDFNNVLSNRSTHASMFASKNWNIFPVVKSTPFKTKKAKYHICLSANGSMALPLANRALRHSDSPRTWAKTGKVVQAS